MPEVKFSLFVRSQLPFEPVALPGKRYAVILGRSGDGFTAWELFHRLTREEAAA